MGLLVEYVLAFDPLPLVDVAAAVPDATLEVDVGQPNQDETPVLVVRATGDAMESLERALEAAPAVGTCSLVDRSEGERRYRILAPAGHWEAFKAATGDPESFAAITANRSIVERIRVTPDGWRQTRRFADREEFVDYCSFWGTAGASVSVHRLCESSAVAEPATTVTDRQRTALRTAHRMGYFDVPRRASLADVAAELEVSASAASERIRRGQGRLLETVAFDA